MSFPGLEGKVSGGFVHMVLMGNLESLPGLPQDMGVCEIGTPEEGPQGRYEDGGFACAPSLCTAKNCCWHKVAKSPDGQFLQKFSSSLCPLLLQGQV